MLKNPKSLLGFINPISSNSIHGGVAVAPAIWSSVEGFALELSVFENGSLLDLLL